MASTDDPQFVIPDSYKIYNYNKSTSSQLLSYAKIDVCNDTASSSSATGAPVKELSDLVKDKVGSLISFDSSGNASYASVILPYPDSIRVDNNLNWTDFNLDSEIYKGGIGELGSIVGGLFGNKLPSGGGILDGVVKALSLAAKGGMYGLRKSLNPGIVEFFSGVSLSEFEMGFNFVPLSQDDANSFKEAYSALKFCALPNLSKGNIFFDWPSLFNLEIYLNQKNICTRKKLAITNISLDMNPNSNPASHSDSMPTNLKLNIRFKETDIVTKKTLENLQNVF